MMSVHSEPSRGSRILAMFALRKVKRSASPNEAALQGSQTVSSRPRRRAGAWLALMASIVPVCQGLPPAVDLWRPCYPQVPPLLRRLFDDISHHTQGRHRADASVSRSAFSL